MMLAGLGRAQRPAEGTRHFESSASRDDTDGTGDTGSAEALGRKVAAAAETRACRQTCMLVLCMRTQAPVHDT